MHTDRTARQASMRSIGAWGSDILVAPLMLIGASSAVHVYRAIDNGMGALIGAPILGARAPAEGPPTSQAALRP